MKQIIFIIFLSLVFVFNIKAQDSLEISQLTPIRKPTKDELKKINQLIKKSGQKDIVCILRTDYDDFLEISVGITNEILSSGKKISVIKAEFYNKSLFFSQIEKGESLASTNIFIRITSNDEKIDGRFEESINFVLTKEQKDKIENLPYQKNFELPQGKYKIQFVARDTQSGIVGYKSLNFEVN